MYMILFVASRAVEGLVRVIECRAVLTRCVGSLMKCLADMMVWEAYRAERIVLLEEYCRVTLRVNVKKML